MVYVCVYVCSSDLSEERRLAYVGFTGAKDILVCMNGVCMCVCM